MSQRFSLILSAILLVALVGRVEAQAPAYEGASPGQKIGVPVYDPASKRYFALMHAQLEPQYMTMWNHVAEAAHQQVYKGVHGRLAIVDSVEVHSFLLQNFRPNSYQYVWIGLRYLCKARKLEWSDGRIVPPGTFAVWDKEWNQDVYTCSNKNDPNDWAPVAYTPEMHSWVVKGNTKGYPWYFVEFPTGGP